MNLLFLTLLDFENIYERNIYTDLLRKFYEEGHNVCVISPIERKKNEATKLVESDKRIHILKLKIGNIQKTNMIEKGISTILLEPLFIKAIKSYFSGVKFDLVLYSTPPITLQRVVKFVKERDDALAYLMLKDIFPQGAVDLGILTKSGIRGGIYRLFRQKEKKLYRDADFIGCMSKANIKYILEHNPEIPKHKLELCPNCIEAKAEKAGFTHKTLEQVRKQYGIPENKIVFMYGGNLGLPQGVDFVIECLKEFNKMANIYTIVCGAGTEYRKIDKAISTYVLSNTKLIHYLPKNQYDMLLNICDVGLVFLNYALTVPNIPSRLLSYMEASIPVFAIVDKATDLGEIIKEGQFGWTCNSNNIEQVVQTAEQIQKCTDLSVRGKNGRNYLMEHYNVSVAYDAIMSHMN